jgi:hypothetical protein
MLLVNREQLIIISPFAFTTRFGYAYMLVALDEKRTASCTVCDAGVVETN